MKESKDIEKILKDSRPPNRELPSTRREAWKRIIERRKTPRKRSPLLKMKPWIWALASIILIILCVYFMILLARVH